MAWLTLNGWEIEVSISNASTSSEEIGPGERAYSGSWRDSRRAVLRRWSCETSILSGTDRRAIEGLLTGRGYSFPFDADLYADSKGLGPNAGYSNTSISTAAKKYGTHSLKITSGGTIVYAAGLDEDYTVAAWHSANGATFHHLAVAYDADTATTTKYLDGTSGATVDNIAVSSGAVTLYAKNPGATAGTVYWDDVLLLPYRASATMISSLVSSTTACGPLPALAAAGDIVKTASTVDVRAMLRGSTITPARIGGAWDSEAGTVSFELVEVTP